MTGDRSSGARLVFRGRRVVSPTGTRAATVHVHDGTIAAVSAYDDVPRGCSLVDVGDAVLMPGLVDTHVHINEPGRTEWEGFESATRAAAAGGITTLVDMPLNSIPPTTTVDGLRRKVAAAKGRCFVDVGFWGGVIPGNVGDLEPLVRAGVLGFKCFLSPSGVDEFPRVTERDLRGAMPVLAALGAPLLVHAELPELLTPLVSSPRYADYLASRPVAAEVAAVALMIRLARELGARVHIVHVSSPETAELIRAARAEGIEITAETCPHYLHFAAEDVADGATALKCAPPIRGRTDRDGLWAALAGGVLDMVVSDHSPCAPDMKALDSGDFARAWGGIASLQLAISIAWRGARERGDTWDHLARWMCGAPAALAGLAGRKGAIAPGCDADLVALDPDIEYVVDPALLNHRHPVTPYAGARLPVAVLGTWLRGLKVYERGRIHGGPRGAIVTRAVQWATSQS